MMFVQSVMKIRERPTAIAGVAMGVAIFGVFFRGEDTRNETTNLRERVVRVESTSPCTNLTAAECALKLFRALPEETRRQLDINQSTIRALERRVARERSTLRERNANGPSTSDRADGGSPGGPSGGSSPPPVTTPPGSSPGNGEPQTPPAANEEEQDKPSAPLVATPEIKTPGIGPVPEVTVPPLEVPCIAVEPVIKCQ